MGALNDVIERLAADACIIGPVDSVVGSMVPRATRAPKGVAEIPLVVVPPDAGGGRDERFPSGLAAAGAPAVRG